MAGAASLLVRAAVLVLFALDLAAAGDGNAQRTQRHSRAVKRRLSGLHVSAMSACTRAQQVLFL